MHYYVNCNTALPRTGCSVAAFWLSGCGGENANLVVINNSGQSVWSNTLNYENETQGVRNAGDHALLEQGQTYGLELEADTATVILSNRSGKELGRTEVNHSGGAALPDPGEGRNTFNIGGMA